MTSPILVTGGARGSPSPPQLPDQRPPPAGHRGKPERGGSVFGLCGEESLEPEGTTGHRNHT
jgi:hypothetical protein